MFRGAPNLLFVSGESEDDSDSDIPNLVADSEDEVIVDELQICFDAQPKRETFRNQCEEYLACLGSPEKSRESEPNVREEVSAVAEPKAGSVHTLTCLKSVPRSATRKERLCRSLRVTTERATKSRFVGGNIYFFFLWTQPFFLTKSREKPSFSTKIAENGRNSAFFRDFRSLSAIFGVFPRKKASPPCKERPGERPKSVPPRKERQT